MKPERGWSLGRKAMVGTLWLGAVWGSGMVIAVLLGREASVIGDMFAGVVALIVTTLGVLVGGKGWKEYTRIRAGGASSKTTVVSEKEVFNDKSVPVE